MREIKFRAWDAINKRMLTSECVALLIDLQGRLNSHDLGILNGYDNTPQYPLMQYTGLKDKNGKEIYEGDIVRYSEEDIGTIEFGYHDTGGGDYYSSLAYGFYVNIPGHVDTEYSLDADRCEVIGNIYENKDLLEK